MGIPPTHLITCSFMAAPASLAVSKLFHPETQQSKTTINDIKVERGDESNVLDAAAKVILTEMNISKILISIFSNHNILSNYYADKYFSDNGVDC